jgi:hypothetical protein
MAKLKDAEGNEIEVLTKDEVAEMVNGAVTSAAKKFPKVEDIVKKTAEKISESLAPTIDEALKAHDEKRKAERGGNDDDDAAGKKKGEKTPDPQLAAVQSQLADLTKKYDAEKSAREAAEKKARDDKAFSELRSSLQPHVRAELLDDLANNLFHIKKVVRVDDDGTILMKVEDTEYELKDGVPNYLKTKSALPYIPAPGQRKGNGNGTDETDPRGRRVNLDSNGLPKYDKPAATDEERIRRSQEQAAAIAKKLESEGKLGNTLF